MNRVDVLVRALEASEIFLNSHASQLNENMQELLKVDAS